MTRAEVKATVVFDMTEGFGGYKEKYGFANNKDMMEFVDKFVAKYQGLEWKNRTITIFSAKMTYVSGKSFTKYFDWQNA